MTKAIILTKQQWQEIANSIADNYPRSVSLIRNRMKEKLGFTVREHQEWIKESGYDGYGNYVETIHLDFYNEPKKTMFLLKYSEIIGKTKT